jgi:site-specific DNA-methyltransferase (adenine-specific)
MNTKQAPDIYSGEYLSVLPEDREYDILLTDPPYSKRVRSGRRTGSDLKQSNIQYDYMDQERADVLAEYFSRRVKFWAVIFCDHHSFLYHEKAWQAVNWYTFAPVPWIKVAPPPRFTGDGPANAAEYIFIARPKKRLQKARNGSRPGWYNFASVRKTEFMIDGTVYPGSKPIALIKQVAADYALTGDRIVDPYAGTFTTGIAADMLGCHFTGAEKNPDVFDAGAARLRAFIKANSQIKGAA